jgi:hypothetical protein
MSSARSVRWRDRCALSVEKFLGTEVCMESHPFVVSMEVGDRDLNSVLISVSFRELTAKVGANLNLQVAGERVQTEGDIAFLNECSCSIPSENLFSPQDIPLKVSTAFYNRIRS